MRLRYNVGFVGLGEQAWTNLLPALAVLPEVNIVAVCDVDRAARMRAALKYQASGYESYKVMLNECSLDAVFAASTPSVHYELLRETLTRGISTFVEKPPTSSTEELREVIGLAERHGTRTQVGLNFNYSEPVQIASQAARSEDFGNLRYMRISHLNDKPSGPLWHSDNRVRDFLLSQTIHALGVALDFGTPRDNEESIHFHGSDNGILFTMSKMFVDRDQGTPFSLELVTSSTSPYFDWNMELISDRGAMVKINSLQEVEFYVENAKIALGATSKWWRSTWRPSPVSSGHRRNGYQAQFEAFFRNDRRGSTVVPTLQNCLPLYELMDRMEEVAHDLVPV